MTEEEPSRTSSAQRGSGLWLQGSRHYPEIGLRKQSPFQKRFLLVLMKMKKGLLIKEKGIKTAFSYLMTRR